MTAFIALLRGINVGGKNKIKMADLKRVLESIGLVRVETYIQSGNVIFESVETEDTLQNMIETAIETNFGFSTAVVLRTAADFEALIQDCPFSEAEIKAAETANSEGESFYVALLTKVPKPEKVEQLNPYPGEADEYRIIYRDLYLLFRHSVRNSKLANNLHKLDTPVTVRNWKTMNKLYTLTNERLNR